MARSAMGAALTRQQQLAQLAIRSSMLRGLLTLWGTVDPLDLSGTIGRFATAGATVVQAGHQESASLALRYVEAFRRAEGAPGVLAFTLGGPPDAGAVAGLLRGAGLSGVVNARRRGSSRPAAVRNGFVKVSGTATSVALDGGRDVITEATAADRAATGKWQRVASGGACAFCAMLASRGPVFEARSARFETHPGCSCTAEAEFEGSALPATSQQFRDEWKQAQREIDVSGTDNDALNAFRRLREDRPVDGRRTPAQPEAS